MSSKKRQHTEIETEKDSTSSTKTSKPNIPYSSTIFTDKQDQEQFKTIYTAIKQCPNILDDISRNIAEYATGNIASCSNPECKNGISILYADKIVLIPDEDDSDNELYSHHTDSNETHKYKYCEASKVYYCNKCMDLARLSDTCNCYKDCSIIELIFEPTASECGTCNKLFNADCQDMDLGCGCGKECGCTAGKPMCGICAEEIQMGLSFCTVCNKQHCADHFALRDDIDGEDVEICEGCYVSEEIDCDKCKNKAKLLWKDNDSLPSEENGDIVMRKCSNDHCNVFICICSIEEKEFTKDKQYTCDKH